MTLNAVRCERSNSFAYLHSFDWAQNYGEDPHLNTANIADKWWRDRDIFIDDCKIIDVAIKQSGKTHYEKEVENLNKAKRYFNEKLPEFKEKYSGKYVGVAESQIIVGNSFDEVKEKIYDQIGYVSMYIKKIGEEPKTYRIRSPRLVR